MALTRDVLTPLPPRFNHDNPSIRLDIRSTNQLLDLAREGVDLVIRSGSLARVPGRTYKQAGSNLPGSCVPHPPI